MILGPTKAKDTNEAQRTCLLLANTAHLAFVHGISILTRLNSHDWQETTRNDRSASTKVSEFSQFPVL